MLDGRAAARTTSVIARPIGLGALAVDGARANPTQSGWIYARGLPWGGMSSLRTLPASRLLALLVAVAAVAVSGVAVALAAGGGATPPAKPLAAAVHDALAAPAVDGVTARIDFTNHLIDAGSVQGSDPLLTGAKGRLWAAQDGHVRLELQSSGGDVQILSDGTHVSVYDAGTNTTYSATLPQDRGAHAEPADKAPAVDAIQKELTRLMEHLDISGATPSNVAGQPAYSVRVSPKRDGGLLDAAELAWDAAHGVPLRAAVYAVGNSAPVLELAATDISFGPIPASAFTVKPPGGTKQVKVDPPTDHAGAAGHAHGQRAAAPAKLPFTLAAPATLAGQARADVRHVDLEGEPAALVTYGHGLGGIAVLESVTGKDDQPLATQAQGRHHHDGPGLELPAVDVRGATGQQLDTALGSVLRFSRGGVTYVVAGSVKPDVLRAAARGL